MGIDPILWIVSLSTSLGLCVGLSVGVLSAWKMLTPTMEKQDSLMGKASETIDRERTENAALRKRLDDQVNETFRLVNIINRTRAALEREGDDD